MTWTTGGTMASRRPRAGYSVSRSALNLADGQSPRTVAMCRKFDSATHNMVLSGGIFLLYEEYMRPGDSGVGGVFGDELARCASGKTTRRDVPGELKGHPSISARVGRGVLSPYSPYYRDTRDTAPSACWPLISSRWRPNSARRRHIPRARNGICDILRPACPLSRVCGREVSVVSGTAKIRPSGDYVLYSDGRYYAAKIR